MNAFIVVFNVASEVSIVVQMKADTGVEAGLSEA